MPLHRLLALLLILPWTTGLLAQGSPDGVWTLLPAEQTASRGIQREPWVKPEHFQAVEIDPPAMEKALSQAPREGALARSAGNTFLLPTPDGRFERFELTESPIMEPALAEWMATQGWPMRTYSARGIDDPTATARLDWGGPAGFHAMVGAPGRSYFIDPAWRDDLRTHLSYFREALPRDQDDFVCGVTGEHLPSPPTRARGASTNGNLRTYRLAMAAAGGYTQFHGGTQAKGQAAIVTTVNRVNQIYERDLSLRLILIGNNSSIVYTDASNDPYSEGSDSVMLDQNQRNLDDVIGAANYDIGHVVERSSGGKAALRSSCVDGDKARGVTGRSSPVGDPFDIDYVAHEIGHQLGGNHTFNTDAGGGCTASRRISATAYEPGSGSTIMAYAGICAPDDLQGNSDAHFHGISLDEALNHLAADGNCAATSASGNSNAPTVDAGPSYTIPYGTPFELTPASSGDADGDALTYVWEEFDKGAAASLADGDLGSDPVDGNNPLFRSWPPAANPTRSIPNLTRPDLGTPPRGEILPTTDRTMNFRVTVRDNHAGGGRVGEDTMTVTSSTAVGPFQVTAPNGGEKIDTSIQPTATVTWNVAGTTGAPTNTGAVAILLSTDSGVTFPYTLTANTPNDGSQTVTLPGGLSTAKARIKVKAAGNIYYDVSDADFSINALDQCSTPNQAIPDPGSVSDSMIVNGAGLVGDLNLYLEVDHQWVGDLSATLEHVGSGTSAVVIDRPGYTGVGDGCAAGNITPTLDDEATAPIETACQANHSANLTSTYTPNNPLSVFDGKSIAGTWKLTLTDTAGGSSGSVNRWCLKGIKATYPLTVLRNGAGSGSVASNPAGIVCGSDCAETYFANTQVTLTATAASGSVFAGWSGGCTGTAATCNLTMSAAKNVTATFNTGSGGSTCQTGALTLTSGYSSGTHPLSSETSILTSGTVVIASGAVVTAKAPLIRLSPGFKAQQGANFNAKAQAVQCSAGRP